MKRDAMLGDPGGHHCWHKGIKKQDWSLTKPQSFWENVLWTDETKVELFGKGHHGTVYRKRNEAFKEKNTVPIQSNMVEVQRCFGVALLLLALDALTVWTVSWNLMITKEFWGATNVVTNVRKLLLHQRSWVFQQDNDPKHTSKSTQKWLQTKRWRVLKWPAMSPDLNLKTAVGKRHPSNLKDLEQFAKEERSNIPVERCKASFRLSAQIRFCAYPDGTGWICIAVLQTAIQFAIQMLSYRRGCAVVLYFVLWGSGRNAGSLNVWLYSVLPTSATLLLFIFFIFILFYFLPPLLSKHKEVHILAVYWFNPLDLHFATTQACFCRDVQHVFCKNVWRVYVLRGVRTWKSYAKSDLTVQTKSDFQKCDLNRIPNHIRM